MINIDKVRDYYIPFLKDKYRFITDGKTVTVINNHGKEMPQIKETNVTVYYLYKNQKRYRINVETLFCILNNLKPKPNNSFKYCPKCNLYYPQTEMRGNICYLCKHEERKIRYEQRRIKTDAKIL